MSRVRRLLEIAEHVVFVYCAFRLFRHVRRVGLKAVLTKTVISVVKAAPGGAALMDREQQKTIAEIKAFANESMGEFDEFGDIKELPHSGWSEEKLFPSMIKLRGIEKDYQQGKVWRECCVCVGVFFYLFFFFFRLLEASIVTIRS